MDQHWYNKKGQLVGSLTPKAVPSATTILSVISKPGLVAWQLRVGGQEAQRRRDESATRGTAIHQLVSDWINGIAVEAISPDHEEALHGFINWQERAQPSELESEIFLYSKAHGYAGTADIICRLDGALWVLDIKTSRAIDPQYGLQLRAYEQALYEHRGEHARTGVLQLTKENKSGYRFKEMDEPLEVFLAAKRLFEWTHQYDKASKFDGRYLSA